MKCDTLYYFIFCAILIPSGYCGIRSRIKGIAKSIASHVLPSSVGEYCQLPNQGCLASDDTSQTTRKSDNEAICYKELGCFANDGPWSCKLRPFPEPAHPDDIDVTFYLYTRTNPYLRYNITTWPEISVEGSDFDASREYTAFITHGFASDGNTSWVDDLKDAYLKRRDANVFITDWGKGASSVNYLQVGANTRIVGSELVRLVKYLTENKGLSTTKIHLMGHSLGGHISSYVGKSIADIGHITAFDPAQPGFEGCSEEIKLTRDDAQFVDVIHTNAEPFIPMLGFGFIMPMGDVDFYMNGGLTQPGCIIPKPENTSIGSIMDLASIPVDALSNWVSCSHGRSYLYYTEALMSDNCTFWGRHAGYIGTVLNVATLGKSEWLLDKLSGCTLEKCVPLGLDVFDYPGNGTYTVVTNSKAPFCKDNPETTKKMIELKEQYWAGNLTKPKGIFRKLVAKGKKVIAKIV